jgi:hypothetical protein
MATATDLETLRVALLRLTASQQVAVEALAVGATHEAAAEKAGVTRETITRWAGHLPSFQAALNLYRSALVHEQIDTARRIRGKALCAVETALDESRIDPLAVLRVVTDEPASIGPTLPEAILDAEMNKTRLGLPPTPPPRWLDALLESVADPGPSDTERAEEATLTRLAAAGLVCDERRQIDTS